MSTFEDFSFGQCVYHSQLGNGIVSGANREWVIVRYDDWKSVGEYDRRWFDLHSDLLFAEHK